MKLHIEELAIMQYIINYSTQACLPVCSITLYVIIIII